MFSEIKDYGAVFETLVTKTADYLIQNNIKAQILGISGGIDSTVVAAICREVSDRTGIPLIGRSLPTKFNKNEETTSAYLVGKAFCDDFEVYSMGDTYEEVENSFSRYESKSPTPISSGNIQARLRMIYLYNVASLHKGIVIDTDNLTEHNLGYWTVHGDVGDFNPIGGLWKTEVFKLAEYLIIRYNINRENDKCLAVEKSYKLKPTAGLGITNNDLEELGAESYEQVDAILQEILAWKSFKDPDLAFKSLEEEKLAFLDEQQMLNYPMEVIIAIAERHFKSEFKRKKSPVKVSRYLLTI